MGLSFGSFPPNKRHQKAAPPQSLTQQNGGDNGKLHGAPGGHDYNLTNESWVSAFCERVDLAITRLEQANVLKRDKDTLWSHTRTVRETSAKVWTLLVTFNTDNGWVQASIQQHVKQRFRRSAGKVGVVAREEGHDTPRSAIIATQSALWKEIKDVNAEHNATWEALAALRRSPHVQLGASSTGALDAPNNQIDTHPKITGSQPPSTSEPSSSAPALRSQRDPVHLGALMPLNTTTEALEALRRSPHVQLGASSTGALIMCSRGTQGYTGVHGIHKGTWGYFNTLR